MYRGQPLAVIFSSELADAQMKYLSMQAMLAADRQKLQRTQKLVEIGAECRQELEEVAATHAARETEVAAARQRLLLFGLSSERVAKLSSASQVVSEVTVPSPAAGLVVTRSVNPGQVVGAGQELFFRPRRRRNRACSAPGSMRMSSAPSSSRAAGSVSGRCP